jgi:hypothetical protein
MPATDLHFAGPLIIDELSNYAGLSALVKKVEGFTDFDSIIQQSQLLPALFVGLAGEKIKTTYEDGKTQEIEEFWAVVTAVASQADILQGKRVLNQSGLIRQQIGNCLAGYRLTEGVANLYPVQPPPPKYIKERAYFFMIFGLNVIRTFQR